MKVALIAAIALLLFAATPAAAFSITPADGWLWKLDVAIDNFRVLVNPALEPVIEAERLDEAHQMVTSGDVVAAQQAMNHVSSDTVKDAIEFTPQLSELEESETASWQGLVEQYGILDTPVEFAVPTFLVRTADGDYEFKITTTSGNLLDTYTVRKGGDVAYVRSGESTGEYGNVRFHWTLTVSELEGLVERYEEMME